MTDTSFSFLKKYSGMDPDIVLLTEEEAAAILRIKPATLTNWRSSGRYDLPFVKTGGKIRYRLSAVLYFIERYTYKNTGERTAENPDELRGQETNASRVA